MAEVAKMELDEDVEPVKEETPRLVLSGYRPDLTYTEVTSATPNTITVMTEVDGHEFHGVGQNFVTAAERAALEVITYLYSTEEIVIGLDRYNTLMGWKKDGTTTGGGDGPHTTSSHDTAASALMIFNQLYQKSNPEWTLTQTSTTPPFRYRVVLKVEDQTFEAEEGNKKHAKQNAAKAALVALRGVFPDSFETLLQPSPSRKRRNDDDRRGSRDPNAPTPPKRKRRPEGGQGTPYTFSEAKNPLQILNEFRRGVAFEVVSQEGPTHAPKMVMKCVIDEKVFEVESSGKQKAKTMLAQQIVDHFVEQGQIKLTPAPEGAIRTPDPSTPSNKPSPQVFGSGAGGKTPLMMLYELAKSQPPCEMEEYEENKMKRFIAKYTIDGKTYEGEGLSKQRAKHKAAEVILRDVYGLPFNATGTNGEGANGDGIKDFRMMQFADRARKAIMEKWRDLCQTLSEENAKRKVIAGIVVTVDMKHEPMEEDGEPPIEDLPDLFSHEDLICITTGTKCLNGEFLSNNGIAMNDCHAEVLSSRCMRLLLLRHIEKLAKGESSILLTQRPEGGASVRPGVRFHLYISTAPCGDSRIFCPHEMGALVGDSHPGRKSRGLLRTKIESGEGTIPVPVQGLGLQTFDGVIQGERLLTMSCSDKLCQWNVVGMQGALLSRILSEPIYFDTIIVGSVFVDSHLDRALYQRVAEVSDVPAPFRAHRPSFLVTTEREERMPRKSPGISVVWIADDAAGDGDTEVINAARGKMEDDKPSSLCKRSMFSMFRTIEKKYPNMIIQKSKVAGGSELYSEAKAVAVEYMQAKRLIQQHLKKTGSGVWIRRPMEQDLFELAE